MSQKHLKLSYVPRRWQRECHLNCRRFTVLALHRRAGKTTAALMQLIDAAAKCEKNLGVFIYMAPLLKQAVNIAWSKLKELVKPLLEAGAIVVSEGDLKITFLHNGSSIRLFGANLPEELRGMGVDGIVIDEVAQIDPVVWQEIVRPTLSDRLGWAWFIGTPHGVNLFSELYFGAAGKPDWFAALYTVYDTNALDPAEVENLKGGMTPNAFSREYLCDFMAAGDEQLISLVDVAEASQRVYRAEDIARAPRILGVDPARFGNDRSVIFRRQGLVAFPPQVFQGLSNMDLASRVANEIKTWKPDAVFVDAGAGAGVIDRLRQLGHEIVEVPFGGKATNEKLYVNKRTEMWWEMREWVVSRAGSIPDIQDLKQELATPIYSYDNQGRRKLESKDEIKKRLQGGRSTDCFVAGTMILTPTGDRPIESIMAGDPVCTPMGDRRVIRTWHTATDRLTTVSFTDGSALTGKGKHKVFTWDAGFVRLDELSLTSECESATLARRWLWKLASMFSTGARSSGFKRLVDTSSPGALRRRSDFFTAGSGSSITERFLLGMRSIIAMATGATTRSRTLSACRSVIMPGLTCWSAGLTKISGSGRLPASSSPVRPRQHGMPRTKGVDGTLSTAEPFGSTDSQSTRFASGVTSSSKPSGQRSPSSALGAVPSVEATSVSRRILSSALSAARRFWRIATGSWRVAPSCARTVAAPGTSVYNLTLDSENVYYANGILVSNCADALCLTFAHPVEARESPEEIVHERGVQELVEPPYEHLSSFERERQR